MKHLPEILKIITAGISSNTVSAKSYAELLASKLEVDGDHKSSKKIRKTLQKDITKHSYSPALIKELSIPVDRDSRFSLADENISNINDVEIQLEPYISNKIDEFIKYVEYTDDLNEAGVGVSPSMLLYGPPGCGKTYLANYISARLRLPILTARCDSLISSYLGSTAKNLRNLFEHAASRPCVLFLDEFDALAKARDDHFELGELKRVVVSLLQNIDYLPTGTILIAATNHEKLLDRAVWRRFAYQLHLNAPSYEVREKLINQYLKKFTPKNIKTLVSSTEGMTNANIKELCESSIRSAIVNEQEKIDQNKLLINLIYLKYHEIIQSPKSPEEKIKQLRSEDSRQFTTRLLSEIFDVSTGKISRILNN